MSFGTDPAVLRVAAGLGLEPRAARAFVRALVSVPAAALPWIDAEDILHTTRQSAPGPEIVAQVLVRARLVVAVEGSGFDLASEGQRLAELLAEERAAAAERKQRSREMKEVVTLCDQRVTSRDIGVTSRDGGVTFRSADGEISSNYRADGGTNRDGEGVASQITRVAGARGNTPPPTPIPETLASHGSASDASMASAHPGAGAAAFTATDIPSLGRWLHATLRRNGFTGPSKLDSNQQSELLDAIRAGLPPETLAGILRQAADNGARKMSWLRVAVERELGDLCYRAPERAMATEASRAPPVGRRGPNEPVPIEEFRLIREHEKSEGDE